MIYIFHCLLPVLIYINSIFNFISAGEDNFHDDIRELKKIDQNVLYDALKHERIQDHVDLNDDDKAFLDRMSKGKQNYLSNICIRAKVKNRKCEELEI